MSEDELIRSLKSMGLKSEYEDGMVIVAVPSYDKDKDKVMKTVKKLGYKRSFGVRPEGDSTDASNQKGHSKRSTKT